MKQTLPNAPVPSAHNPTRRTLRVAFVTESYPPEINGVANTVERVVEGLHARRHDIQLVRPRQGPSDTGRQTDRFARLMP